MLTLLADRYIYRLPDLLPPGIKLISYDPRKGIPVDQLKNSDALFVRTVTVVNRETVGPAYGKVKFVGTASAGTDHVDVNFLYDHKIHFASSAGCNSRSVAEYVAVALLLWSEEHHINPQDLRVGIVGVGHAGSEVDRLLKRLGMRTILYDPPREQRENGFRSADLETLATADVLTLHVPLTMHGPWATHHWLDGNKFENHNFRFVINAARGGVIHEKEFLIGDRVGKQMDYALDVWENEPAFTDDMAKNAFIATPHIAGYSEQAKFRATQMIVNQLLDYFKFDRNVHASDQPVVPVDLNNTSKAKIGDLLKQLHPIMGYDQKLRNLIGLPATKKGSEFMKLRTGIPFRNEFSFLTIPSDAYDRYPLLKQLGFSRRKHV